MVVPNAMGPEGMSPGSPSFAPVGVNKHRVWAREKDSSKSACHSRYSSAIFGCNPKTAIKMKAFKLDKLRLEWN